MKQSVASFFNIDNMVALFLLFFNVSDMFLQLLNAIAQTLNSVPNILPGKINHLPHLKNKPWIDVL